MSEGLQESKLNGFIVYNGSKPPRGTFMPQASSLLKVHGSGLHFKFYTTLGRLLYEFFK